MYDDVRIYGVGGPANAGKGTLLSLLEKAHGGEFVVISVGNRLRKEVKEGTELGLQAKTYMENGKLVPDDIINKVFLKIIDEVIKEGKCHKMILDGYPRSPGQVVEMLKSGVYMERMIEITLPEDVLIKRGSDRVCCVDCGETYTVEDLHKRTKKEGVCDKCGGNVVRRPDDAPEKVKVRLQSYLDDTYPMYDVLRKAGVEVVSIDRSETGDVDRFFEAVDF